MTLDADDLTALRATQAEFLPDPCVISDYVRTRTGGTGYTEAWIDRGAMVNGRVGAITPAEARRFAEQIAAGGSAILTLPYGTPLKVRDRIVNMTNGGRWEVVAFTEEGSWTTAVRALVRAV